MKDKNDTEQRLERMKSEFKRSSNKIKPPSDIDAIRAHPLAFLGGTLAVVSIGALIYFIFFFDTSVALSDSDVSVNNLGLMQDRQTGVIVACFVILIGVGIALADFLKKRS
jgi:hypothetical protein